MDHHETVERARAAVAKILEVEPAEVVDDADFRDDLDADSLQLAEIAAALESDFGLESDPDAPPTGFAEIRDRLTARTAP